MKKFTKILFSLITGVVLMLSMSVTVSAADSVITYNGQDAGFGFKPGSGYTQTDLFENFKNVMPGDKLEETITISNRASDCDYIKVYMRAEVHDEAGTPLTYDEAFENTDGKDQAGIAGERDETVASMADFLSRLTMRIHNEDRLIYEASPDEAGTLVNNVLLGTLYNGESAVLTVELDIPIELGNEYANRVGEVNWVIMAEAYSEEAEKEETETPEESESSGSQPSPTPGASPKTGDTTNIHIYLALAGVSALVLILLLVFISKKRKGDEQLSEE